jgi:hypothetical protein
MHIYMYVYKCMNLFHASGAQPSTFYVFDRIREPFWLFFCHQNSVKIISVDRVLSPSMSCNCTQLHHPTNTSQASGMRPSTVKDTEPLLQLHETHWNRVIIAVHCNILQHTATLTTDEWSATVDSERNRVKCWNRIIIAIHCNTLQHTATYCNILQPSSQASGAQPSTAKETESKAKQCLHAPKSQMMEICSSMSTGKKTSFCRNNSFCRLSTGSRTLSACPLALALSLFLSLSLSCSCFAIHCSQRMQTPADTSLWVSFQLWRFLMGIFRKSLQTLAHMYLHKYTHTTLFDMTTTRTHTHTHTYNLLTRRLCVSMSAACLAHSQWPSFSKSWVWGLKSQLWGGYD